MSLFHKIKEFLFPTYKPAIVREKTLKELDTFDTVWVLDTDNTLLEGWIYEITKKHIFVVAPSANFTDFRFSVKKPLSQVSLTENGRTLFVNKPCTSETSYTSRFKEDL